MIQIKTARDSGHRLHQALMVAAGAIAVPKDPADRAEFLSLAADVDAALRQLPTSPDPAPQPTTGPTDGKS